MKSVMKTARIAGLLYLIIIIAGIFAEFGVRSGLVVSGDSAATVNNIIASESLFRIGIVADLIMIMSDVALALLFYVLFKVVNNTISLLAAFFRLTQAAILGFNLLNLFFVLQLLDGTAFLNSLGADQLQTHVMLFLGAHGIGYSVGLVFFGVQCLVLGYLIYKSEFLPKALGVLMVIAGTGYLIDSFALVIMSNYEVYADIFAIVVFTPAIIGELALCLWLLVKGVNVERYEQRALESA